MPEYEQFDPNECYWLIKSEFLESIDRKDFFWQVMVWSRMNEEGKEMVMPKMYCYGKN